MTWIVAGLTLVACIGLGQAETWHRYTNDRFGASAEIPSDFKADPPPENDDGRTFVSKDGKAKILVYGSYAPSVVVESFAAYRHWVRNAEKEGGLTISYDAGGRDWFALSGMAGDQITYLKVIGVCSKRSLALHVRIEYPAAEKRRYDTLVSRVGGSLRHISGLGC